MTSERQRAANFREWEKELRGRGMKAHVAELWLNARACGLAYWYVYVKERKRGM